ncbi:putative (-)-germacrene D synthase [Medicago truncatula]|nr:putative (-)-germacrene D synthase [Medicago truncatula]
MINAAIILCRLMDDIASNEQHNISREGAIQEGRKRIVDAWKDMNKECLMPTEVPMPFLTCILNLSRLMDVVYNDKDNFTHPEGEMKTFIKSLLVDSVPI